MEQQLSIFQNIDSAEFDKKVERSIEKVRGVGSCSYCEKGGLKVNGMGLNYPYDEVVVIGN